MREKLIASILPGWRDLRVPLIVGFLWTAFAWLLIAPAVHGPLDGWPFLADVYRPLKALGQPATLATVTFVAYVMGIIMTYRLDSMLGFLGFVSRIAFRIYPPFLRRRLYRAEQEAFAGTFAPMSASSRLSLSTRFNGILDNLQGKVPSTDIIRHLPSVTAAWQRQLSAGRHPSGVELSEEAREEEFWSWIRLPQTWSDHILDDVLRDLPLAASRLLRAHPVTFDRYDRASSEAEFRYALFLPLTALSLLALTQFALREPSHAWWVIGVFGVLTSYFLFFIFFFRGMQKHLEANDIIVQSIEEGVIQSPAFERLTSLDTRRGARNRSAVKAATVDWLAGIRGKRTPKSRPGKSAAHAKVSQKRV